MPDGEAEREAQAPELSWILPLYRTSAHLEELLSRITRAATQMGVAYEIVLVDDACPEGSGEAAERAALRFPSVQVVRLSQNQGQDGALRAGLRLCRGQWAVLLDADLQDPPEAVADLWSKRGQGTEAVFANRVGTYTTRARHLTSKIYRRVASLIGGLPEGACLFVLLDRRLIDHVASTQSEAVSILAAIAAGGGSLKVVPITRWPRPSGRSAYSSTRRAAKAFLSLWQMFLTRRAGRSL